ncbi:hypothetical protein EVAR_11017_1 [Eumeta japonica]|uniref:Uncharacterized protein n=1 Tax=Eumeta variegata TaxID=151549 RepID=A0A4C1YLM5_EUMVA|nr:hypothetical protein EVAR_11017_1 [Eumeta japonica]
MIPIQSPASVEQWARTRARRALGCLTIFKLSDLSISERAEHAQQSHGLARRPGFCVDVKLDVLQMFAFVGGDAPNASARHSAFD